MIATIMVAFVIVVVFTTKAYHTMSPEPAVALRLTGLLIAVQPHAGKLYNWLITWRCLRVYRDSRGFGRLA